MYLSDAVLITGGFGSVIDTAETAELYVPSSGLSCSLPSLPSFRVYHTVESTGLLCGGEGSEDSCLKWRPDNGTWEEDLTMKVRRRYHASWTPSSGSGTYLIGGKNRVTATLIKPDGTQETSFRIKYSVK